MPVSDPDFQIAGSAYQEAVHDLRNIFSVIVSACRLLNRDGDLERGEDLVAAIEDAALRGSLLTTDLLACDACAVVHALETAFAHGTGPGRATDLAKATQGTISLWSVDRSA